MMTGRTAIHDVPTHTYTHSHSHRLIDLCLPTCQPGLEGPYTLYAFSFCRDRSVILVPSTIHAVAFSFCHALPFIHFEANARERKKQDSAVIRSEKGDLTRCDELGCTVVHVPIDWPILLQQKSM